MTITILYMYNCQITKLFKGNFWVIFYRQAPDAEAGRESTTATDDDEDAQNAMQFPTKSMSVDYTNCCKCLCQSYWVQ